MISPRHRGPDPGRLGSSPRRPSPSGSPQGPGSRRGRTCSTRTCPTTASITARSSHRSPTTWPMPEGACARGRWSTTSPSGGAVSRYNSFDRWAQEYDAEIAGRRPVRIGGGDSRRPDPTYDRSYVPNREADRRFQTLEDERTREYYDQEDERERIATQAATRLQCRGDADDLTRPARPPISGSSPGSPPTRRPPARCSPRSTRPRASSVARAASVGPRLDPEAPPSGATTDAPRPPPVVRRPPRPRPPRRPERAPRLRLRRRRGPGRVPPRPSRLPVRAPGPRTPSTRRDRPAAPPRPRGRPTAPDQPAADGLRASRPPLNRLLPARLAPPPGLAPLVAPEPIPDDEPATPRGSSAPR